MSSQNKDFSAVNIPLAEKSQTSTNSDTAESNPRLISPLTLSNMSSQNKDFSAVNIPLAEKSQTSTNSDTAGNPEVGLNQDSQTNAGSTGTIEKKALHEQMVYPEMSRRATILMVIGLAVAMFLSALDNTIVSTALPTIASDFNNLSSISWVATSYMLTATALQPIYGNIADIFGAKGTILTAIFVFEVGSLLCGLSNSMTMLIFVRGVSGIGGAGIMTLAMIILSQTIPLSERGQYMGFIGAAFGLSSIAGPLLGGLFTDKASWRWCFYINLPLGAIAIVAIIFLVKIDKPKGNLMEKLKRLDVVGVLIMICAIVMILLALNWGGTTYPWNSSRIIALLVVGILCIFIFIAYEYKFPKEPVIPLRIFRTRNLSLNFANQFLIGFGMFGLIFFMPMYYTVVYGGNATQSGLFLLPFMLGIVATSVSSGALISKTGVYRSFIWSGNAIFAVGIGLVTILNQDTKKAVQVIILLICGLALGLTMQPSLISVQASSTPDTLSMTTTLLQFFRVIGGTIGMTIVSTIMQNSLKTKLAVTSTLFPKYTKIIEAATKTAAVIRAPGVPKDLQEAIIDAYVKSIRAAFIVLIPITVIAFLIGMGITHIPLRAKKPKKEEAIEDENVL
ncbi:hypothetical protein BB559_002988 [Furculomyces boomerangus]|uniref:Major facilitator superfamily (MFS) profile domain-containing protein n=1 Tax=Furculomyces boomerangus TaxID=61424 RepID=A0A2T9YQ69_9FUNG|nr:hypothetical protein BB559_002988 [Furculomyces boomerangus]